MQKESYDKYLKKNVRYFIREEPQKLYVIDESVKRWFARNRNRCISTGQKVMSFDFAIQVVVIFFLVVVVDL